MKKFLKEKYLGLVLLGTIHFHIKWPDSFSKLWNIVHYILFSVILESGFDQINISCEIWVGKSCIGDMM